MKAFDFPSRWMVSTWFQEERPLTLGSPGHTRQLGRWNLVFSAWLRFIYPVWDSPLPHLKMGVCLSVIANSQGHDLLAQWVGQSCPFKAAPATLWVSNMWSLLSPLLEPPTHHPTGTTPELWALWFGVCCPFRLSQLHREDSFPDAFLEGWLLSHLAFQESP